MGQTKLKMDHSSKQFLPEDKSDTYEFMVEKIAEQTNLIHFRESVQ